MCTTRLKTTKKLLLFKLILLFISHTNSTSSISEELTGNWFTEHGGSLATEGPCNIDVRDHTITQTEFLTHYAYNAPLIINLTADYNQAIRVESERSRMLEKYQNKIIKLSSANTHSYEKRDVTLLEYVDNYLHPQDLNKLGSDTFYWFGDNNYTEWSELFDLYKQPPVTLPEKTGSYSFGLAGAGTGVPFHWHGPGFAEVVYGRKRWFLYPYETTPSFHPNKTTLQWLIEDYPNINPKLLPYECTLHQNQVIYFPDMWWHATLNLDTSVFISTFLG